MKLIKKYTSSNYENSIWYCNIGPEIPILVTCLLLIQFTQSKYDVFIYTYREHIQKLI